MKALLMISLAIAVLAAGPAAAGPSPASPVAALGRLTAAERGAYGSATHGVQAAARAPTRHAPSAVHPTRGRRHDACTEARSIGVGCATTH